MASFRERLKQELKIMKQEVEMMPKAQRKDALRMRKAQMEAQHNVKVGSERIISQTTTPKAYCTSHPPASLSGV